MNSTISQESIDQQENILSLEKAIFAAGCFWGVEDTFRKQKGVVHTRVGYTGGHSENPSYAKVCTGLTGHAEAVEVTFDKTKTSYEQLLNVFWECHNPTTKNRQGFDIGSQYRSAIFSISDVQSQLAQESKIQQQQSGKYRTQGLFKQNIVTQIEPLTAFYEAEDYHQQYFEKEGISHCAI